MNWLFVAISGDSASVYDAHGIQRTISLSFTPRQRFLTQETKREILATGFLQRAFGDKDLDPTIIQAVLKYLRKTALSLTEAKDA